MERMTHDFQENFKREKKQEQEYEKLLKDAEVFDYSPTRGCIVLRPYGWQMWKSVQEELGGKLQAEAGAEDAYFPALIPLDLIEKEKAHIKGFTPELISLAIGGKDTGLVLRPTSETIIYNLFSHWIKNYRDLPLSINQWCPVYRAELRTHPFLRTREFLWQELHAAHTSDEEASVYVRKILDIYLEFLENHLAITAIAGLKTEKEKFPGANYTITLEAMPQEKALQVGTSHNLGTGFSEAFKVKYLDRDNRLKSVVLTSHGVSWRVLGALFLSHQDERGIILPPKVAPFQIVIAPVFGGKKTEEVIKRTNELSGTLTKNGFRVTVDRREDKTLGAKLYYWDAKGVPLRIIIGDREIDDGCYEITRRDKGMKDPSQKLKIPFGDVTKTAIKDMLEDVQKSLLSRSRQHLEESIRPINKQDELEKLLETQGGFGATFLCDKPECEDQLKELKASVRCIPFSGKEEKGKCIFCGDKSSYNKRVLVAKAY